MTGINIIAAAKDTSIINRHGDIVATVVGWQYLQTNMVFPVFAIARSGVRADEAIWYENGGVEHPGSQKVFQDADAWVAWAEDNVKDADAESVPVGRKPEVEPKGDSNGMGPINFSKKKYATKSYWKWDGMRVIFEIEPDLPYPDDERITKIKRDEFAQLKREKWDKVDPHSGVTTEAEADADQAEPDADDEDMDVV